MCRSERTLCDSWYLTTVSRPAIHARSSPGRFGINSASWLVLPLAGMLEPKPYSSSPRSLRTSGIQSCLSRDSQPPLRYEGKSRRIYKPCERLLSSKYMRRKALSFVKTWHHPDDERWGRRLIAGRHYLEQWAIARWCKTFADFNFPASLVDPPAPTGDRRCEGGHEGAGETHHQHGCSCYRDQVN